MIVDPGQEFDLLRSGALDGGVIEDEHALTIITGQAIKKKGNFQSQLEEKSTPAESTRPKEVVDDIFAEFTTFICDHGTKDILTKKWQ